MFGCHHQETATNVKYNLKSRTNSAVALFIKAVFICDVMKHLKLKKHPINPYGLKDSSPK